MKILRCIVCQRPGAPTKISMCPPCERSYDRQHFSTTYSLIKWVSQRALKIMIPVILAMLLALTVPARAQESPQVTTHWMAGNASYDARAWDDAYLNFWLAVGESSDGLHPDSVLLFNMAQTTRRIWEMQVGTPVVLPPRVVAWHYSRFLEEISYRYIHGESLTDDMRRRVAWARKQRDRFAAIARKEGPR